MGVYLRLINTKERVQLNLGPSTMPSDMAISRYGAQFCQYHLGVEFKIYDG